MSRNLLWCTIFGLVWVLAVICGHLMGQVVPFAFVGNRPAAAAAGGGATGLQYTGVVQFASLELTRQDLMPANSEYIAYFPNGTQASNVIAVPGQMADTSGFTVSCSDDQTNTYTLVTNKLDAGNSQQIYWLVATNCRAGTRMIRIKNANAVNIQWVGNAVAELCGVGAIDKVSAASGSSLTLQSGSFTPSQSNDFIMQWCVKDSGTNYLYTNGLVANWATRLLFADVTDSQALQYGLYNDTAAINPTMKAALSHGYLSASIAWKTAAIGNNAPTNDLRALSVQHLGVDPGTFLTQQVHFPCRGNAQIFGWAAGDTNEMPTNVTSSIAGNTWTQVPSGENHKGVFECSTWWYCTNASPSSSNILTVKYRGRTGGHANIWMFDLQGASITNLFDARSFTNGTQSVANNLTNLPPITIGKVGNLLLGMGQWATNTATNITVGSFLAGTYAGMPINGPQNLDQNAALWLYSPPDLTPLTNAIKFMTNSGINGPVATYVTDVISLNCLP